MFSPLVVEVHPVPDAFACRGYGVVGGEVDFFVFEAAPEPLDEDVVDPAAFAVHVDAHLRLGQRSREFLRS